jgi:hypothetical protein
MYSAQVIKLYENGRRGRPVPMIMPGDLADPYRKSPWHRAKSLFSTIVEIWRESRALEAELLAKRRYRAFRED